MDYQHNRLPIFTAQGKEGDNEPKGSSKSVRPYRADGTWQVAAPFRYSQQQPRPCPHIHSQGMESSEQQRTYASMAVSTLGDYPTPHASIHTALRGHRNGEHD